jgi:hypothetical protein
MHVIALLVAIEYWRYLFAKSRHVESIGLLVDSYDSTVSCFLLSKII